jgi:hypothetical protein
MGSGFRRNDSWGLVAGPHFTACANAPNSVSFPRRRESSCIRRVSLRLDPAFAGMTRSGRGPTLIRPSATPDQVRGRLFSRKEKAMERKINNSIVIPANAGIHVASSAVGGWVPAFAGMTTEGLEQGPRPSRLAALAPQDEVLMDWPRCTIHRSHPRLMCL